MLNSFTCTNSTIHKENFKTYFVDPYQECYNKTDLWRHVATARRILNQSQVAGRSKVWVCDRSLAGIAGSNPAWRMRVCLFKCRACGQVEVSAMGPSLVQRSPTECGGYECDLETSSTRRPSPK